MTSVFRSSVLLAAIACSMSCTAQAPAADAAKAGDKAAAGAATAKPSAAMAGMSEKQRDKLFAAQTMLTQQLQTLYEISTDPTPLIVYL